MEDDIRGYGDVTWVWVVSQPVRRRGYFLRLRVEEFWRGKGIGTALASRGFEALFDAGCGEIALVADDKEEVIHFYERFGFQKRIYFLRSRWLDKY